MEALHLNRLKQKIRAQEGEDKELRASVRAALGESHADMVEIGFQKKTIFLRAKNKPVANEIFLRREELTALLPGWEIRIQ